MQKNNLDFVIEAATVSRSDIAGAVRGAIEVGVVVPSILRSNLEAAGYTVKEDEAALAEYGFASMKTLKRVLVTDEDGELVAMGAAGDHGEAILHAMLGYFREHTPPSLEAPQGIATAPTG